jgi:hypothetical protein
MKKYNRKKRDRDVRDRISSLRKSRCDGFFRISKKIKENNKRCRKLISRAKGLGVRVSYVRNDGVIVFLPAVMNFSSTYETTALCIKLIRTLVEIGGKAKSGLRLVRVDFSDLKKISTSASLVLTAEISRWDDSIRRRLKPLVESWDQNIFEHFYNLGFFDLFENKSGLPDISKNDKKKTLSVVRYIKGLCGDGSKIRCFKQRLVEIIGSEIEKWTFLVCGLDEAITNVSHHAYPATFYVADENKCWYLSSGFCSESRELKVVFYDQGVGIQNTLPSSGIYEKVVSFLADINASLMRRKKDEVMLKAAMVVDRTSTGDEDRGKGLQDLLEFIKHRGDGYLSVLSGHALYKYSMSGGVEETKSASFKTEMQGTLLIWCVRL